MNLLTIAVAEASVFFIAFAKGALGGGFAMVGVPLLSLVMDPISAGTLLAPMFVVMDLYALRYWKPSTWSRQDLSILIPGLVVGIGVGYLLLRHLDHRAIAIVIATVTLVFAMLWFAKGGIVMARPRCRPVGFVAGTSAGLTTMVAHSGGPPLAMYLLPLGLPKEIYAGTTSLFFTTGNAIKLAPWLLLGARPGWLWPMVLLCLPAVPLGISAGLRFHGRLNQCHLYRICYGLLVVTALNLLWDGIAGYVWSPAAGPHLPL